MSRSNVFSQIICQVHILFTEGEFGTIYTDSESESDEQPQGENSDDRDDQDDGVLMEPAVTELIPMVPKQKEYDPHSYFKEEPLVYGYRDESPEPSDLEVVS